MAKYECDQCEEKFNAIKDLKSHQQDVEDHSITYGRGKLAKDFKIDEDSDSDSFSEVTNDSDEDNGSEDESFSEVTAEDDNEEFDFSSGNKSDEDLFSDDNAGEEFKEDSDNENEDSGSDSLEDSSMTTGDMKIELGSEFFEAPNDAMNRMVRMYAAKKYGKKPRQLTDEELEDAAKYTKVIFDEAVPDEHKRATGMMGAVMGIASIHMSVMDDMEKVETEDEDSPVVSDDEEPSTETVESTAGEEETEDGEPDKVTKIG